MTRTNFHQQKIAFSCTITLAIISSINHPLKLWAQPNQTIGNSDGVKIHFYPLLLADQNQSNTSGDGRPPTTTHGGSRGDCLYKEKPLTPLLSANNSGLTLEEHPTFWVYVPYTSAEATTGNFSLQDEEDNDIYRTSFTLPATPGFVSISVPSTQQPLEINKRYRWDLTLDCPAKESSEKPTPPFVGGWVKRISLNPDLESQLKAAKTPQERIAFYAKNDIWYERLTELAKLQNTTPNRDWTELLKSLGLESLAQERIMGSVKTNSPPE